MICAVCETETTATPCTECGNEPLLVGRYRLERTLGRGAQGTTFLATGPDGLCAIKELHLGRAGMGKRAELIHREAAVLEQIDHPNIPSLHEHFVDGVGMARSLYLVQDHVQGENLEERLKTHRFTHVEVTDIVQQTGHILAALHALSPPVIHRDIKPSNLMIDDHGQVHLIDFGSVRDVMRDTVGGGSTVAGTFGYMPPEQLVGDATPQSDIYALGMTAVRLLTRQEPATLTDRTGRLTWRQHAKTSSAMAHWVDAMVHRDPLRRSTAETVAHGPEGPPQAPSDDVPQAPPPPIAAERFPAPSTSTARDASLAPTAPEPQRVRRKVVQSGTDVIQFKVPQAFNLADVQRVARMAAAQGLLPKDAHVRPVGNSGGLFHLSTRPDGLPIGNGPWMVVQTHNDETTLLLQPLSPASKAVSTWFAAVIAFAAVVYYGPVTGLGLGKPEASMMWFVVGIIGALVAAAVAFIASMRPRATRRTGIETLKRDIVKQWASDPLNASLPREGTRPDNEQREATQKPSQTVDEG